jgi:hypothetical protein
MDQQTLDGDIVPIEREEKTTTTISWKSEYYKISLKEKDYENLITGATGEDSESFIMKRMKLHTSFPVANMGKVFKAELKKLKAAIMEGSEEAEKEEEVEKTDGDESQGKDQPEETDEIQPPESQPPEQDEDEKIKVLVQSLVIEERQEPLEEYLINNFQPDVITKVAQKMHIRVGKNDLPQKTALSIAKKITALKEKGDNKR